MGHICLWFILLFILLLIVDYLEIQSFSQFFEIDQ